MMIAWTKLIIYGIIIGIANSIPGVSGGTMAVILNIYTALISAISSIRTDFKKSMRFLLPIGAGLATGIFLFSQLISYSLEHFNIPTNFFFIGLIVGSIPMLYKKTVYKSKNIKLIIPFVLSMIVILLTVYFIPDTNDSLITVITLENAIKLFISGVLAAAAMIVPGLSGSFILLLLGVFTSVYTAVAEFNIAVLLFVGLGCIVGILLGTKAMDFLLKKYSNITYSCITGLVFGSIFAIYPGFTFDLTGLIAIILFILGIALTLWFSSEKRSYISISRKQDE